jgi:hypothetical protein
VVVQVERVRPSIGAKVAEEGENLRATRALAHGDVVAIAVERVILLPYISTVSMLVLLGITPVQ